jgi:hypothetical protein
MKTVQFLLYINHSETHNCKGCVKIPSVDISFVIANPPNFNKSKYSLGQVRIHIINAEKNGGSIPDIRPVPSILNKLVILLFGMKSKGK